MNELVIMQDHQAVTSSLTIAEVFGKEHKNVLKDIDDLAAKNLATRNMFEEGNYLNRGKKYKQYFMNRDGFTLLAMGYTGAKALDFKLKYIEAFNKMEQQLQLKAPTSMIEALTLALEQQKELAVKDQIIGELKPKADYTDSILRSTSLVTISQIAKDYGMSGTKFNQLLFEKGIQYKQSGQWLLYAKHQSKGYTHSETIDIKRSDGRSDVRMNTKWTQKGRLALYDLLKKDGVLPTIERGLQA